MNEPIPTSISYLGRRSGLPQHCRVYCDSTGNEFVLHVGRPDEARWWRNFLSPWPVTVIEPDRMVQGTGLAQCSEDEEILVRVRPIRRGAR